MHTPSSRRAVETLPEIEMNSNPTHSKQRPRKQTDQSCTSKVQSVKSVCAFHSAGQKGRISSVPSRRPRFILSQKQSGPARLACSYVRILYRRNRGKLRRREALRLSEFTFISRSPVYLRGAGVPQFHQRQHNDAPSGRNSDQVLLA